jgi:hypothetical protein
MWHGEMRLEIDPIHAPATKMAENQGDILSVFGCHGAGMSALAATANPRCSTLVKRQNRIGVQHGSSWLAATTREHRTSEREWHHPPNNELASFRTLV